MMAIPLTRGKVAIVDDEDFEALSKFKWMAKEDRNGKFYAVRTVGSDHGGRTSIYMARVIAQPRPGQMVDHDNGDTLFNVRKNLRPCTRVQNQRNRHARNSASGFKGVRRRDHAKAKPYSAEISINRRNVFLGYFATAAEAARAYDAAALEHFGQFANLNFKEGARQ